LKIYIHIPATYSINYCGLQDVCASQIRIPHTLLSQFGCLLQDQKVPFGASSDRITLYICVEYYDVQHTYTYASYNKNKISSSSWFYYKKFNTMHGHMNVKFMFLFVSMKFTNWNLY